MPLSVSEKICFVKESFFTIFGSEESTCSLQVGSVLFNTLGAIPVIGVAIGIIRLANVPEVDDHASIEEDQYHNKCLKAFCIIRSTLEILGMGIICWLLDRIVNLAILLIRFLSKREERVFI